MTVAFNNQRSITIDDINVLIQAAIDGQGVTRGPTFFVEDHLVSGRLVTVFDEVLITGYSNYIVCTKSHL